MVVGRTILKCHIIDQVVLLAVSYDGNNNQIVSSYQVVTSGADDNCVWFKHAD